MSSTTPPIPEEPEVPQESNAAKVDSIMSRPRPMTRRFYLDRPDLEKLCGVKGINRLRAKIPQTIIEKQRTAGS